MIRVKNDQGWNFLSLLLSSHRDAKWSSCCWHQLVSQIFFNHQTKNQGWRLSRWKNYQGWNFLLSLVSHHHDAKWSSCCWHQLISQIFSKDQTQIRVENWSGLKMIRVEKLSGLKFPAFPSVSPSWCEMELVLLASTCFAKISTLNISGRRCRNVATIMVWYF